MDSPLKAKAILHKSPGPIKTLSYNCARPSFPSLSTFLVIAAVLLLGCSQSGSATDVPVIANSVPTTSRAASVWIPSPKTSWQWQVEGRKVVCYMNAGGWEELRPNAGEFPTGIIGDDLDD